MSRRCGSCPLYLRREGYLGATCRGDNVVSEIECTDNLQMIISNLKNKLDDRSNTIIVFRFETGDTDCPYWDVMVRVNASVDVKEIEDSFSSYLDSDNYSDDEDFEESVKVVMDATGFKWEYCGDASINIITI